MVKNDENSVFRVIYVRKKEKSLGSGPFPRDGRVTGNKHLFFRPKLLNKLTLFKSRRGMSCLFQGLFLVIYAYLTQSGCFE